jgi:uncharacterized MAPEG superfamily protein
VGQRRLSFDETLMTVPVWMLLAFATWTVVLLLGTVGVYRWSRILTGSVPISEFRADRVEGEDWYKRAMRAHANCVENLPVFGAVVLALQAGGVRGPMVSWLCIGVVAARVVQSLVHVSFVQTNAVVSVRFAFFVVQLVAFLSLSAIIVRHVGVAW